MTYKHETCCLILGLATAVALCPVALAEQGPFSVGATRTPKYTGQDSGVCFRCHSGEKMHAIADSPHGKPEKPDSSLPSWGCESCHGPGSFHVSRAHGGRGFPRMITFGRGSGVASREQQLKACLACHNEGSGEVDAIIWWGSIHDRGNFNCSSCHLIHAEFDPIKEKEYQDKTCFKCHRKQKSGHPKFEDKSIDFATLSCWTCHDVHNTLKTEKPLDSDQKP